MGFSTFWAGVMDSISTFVAIVTGLGALVAIWVGLKPVQDELPPIPPPPPDADADDRYGLGPSHPFIDEASTPVGRSAASAGFPFQEQEAAGIDTGSRGERLPRDRGPDWSKTGMRDLVVGLALLGAAVVPLMLLTNPLHALPITGALGWFGQLMLRRGAARQHGIAVERQARKSIKLPQGWTVDESVPVYGRGDADLLLTDPEGVRYVIEIKANEQVEVRKSWFSSGAEVRGADGRKLPRDPLEQVTALAGILHARPVLWFPKARDSSVVRIGRPEVLVVLGGARHLRKAIGAGGGWFF